MMSDRAPDSVPYEMLRDAAESMRNAHDAIHAIALDINTAKSERATMFRHIDQIRAEIKDLDAYIRGNGDKGLRGRVEALEEGRSGEKWKAIGQIAVAVVAALSLYLQLTGG